MANVNLDQLKVDVGLVKLEECTPQENSEYSEMKKNEQPLPEDICRTSNGGYCRILPNVPEDKAELYLLMRISKDLHFIKVLFAVLLALGIVGVLVTLLFGQLW